MEKIKVLVSGCKGRMGKIVCDLIAKSDNMEVVIGFDSSPEAAPNVDSKISIFKTVRDLQDAVSDCETLHIPDVIIDFSQPEGTIDLLENFAFGYGIPMVIGTTGFSDEQLQHINKWLQNTLVFMATNMSYSIALLEEIVREFAPKFPGYDIEIVEEHHNQKTDSPSGTAKTLASAINSSLGNQMNIVYGRNGKREKNEIGIASLRGANIVGTHTINFYGPSDTISITHTAHSREMFAEGALKAATYLLKCKKIGVTYGLFTMVDMINDPKDYVD